MTTCMLESKGLAANIWDETMNVSTYINNIFSHSSFRDKSPFESNIGHKPDVSNLRVFGSTAWARILMDKRKYSKP